MTNISNSSQLAIIAGVLSMGEFEVCSEKANIYYQDNENSLIVEINFHDCTEHFDYQVEGIPVQLTEEAEDLIYTALYDARQTYLNDADMYVVEFDMDDYEQWNKFY